MADLQTDLAKSQARVVGGCSDFAEGLAGYVLGRVGIGRKRDVVDEGGEGELAAGLGDDVARQALSIEHHFSVEMIAGAERSCFCEDVACARILRLNFGKGAVFAEDGKRVEENVIVGPRGPISEIVAHEIGAEEIGPVAAGAVALRCATEIEFGVGEECAFEFESFFERVASVLARDCAEKIRTHSGVKILADL